MIFKKLLDFRFYTQNTIDYSNEILDDINNKKLLFESRFYLKHSNDPVSYNFSQQCLNIPKNFFIKDYNYLQFISINTFLGESTLNFIVRHELGHLNHQKSFGLNSHKYLNNKSNYIKTGTALDRFFDRILIQDNPIDDFIHMNFTESYADAYAGLTSYLYDKNSNIFESITKFRTHNLNSLKRYEYFDYKLNQNKSSTLEITSGKFSTSRYSNILISDHIKNNIVNTFLFEQLNSLTIDNLHALLQIEVLKSLNQTLINEINKNPLFNNDFYKYLLIKNISVEAYFNDFEVGIKKYQNQTILNIIQSSFVNQNKDLLVDFIDFHIKNKFQPYTFKVPLLTPIDESKITSLILEDIHYGNKINHLNFSKFITNKYILPINDLDSFMSYMEKKGTNNPKFNEIIKSLEPDLIQSLINYNNLPINNPSLPQVTSYSQQDLVDTITKDLSAKDKKQFVDYIEKNNIKEITTAYLSSSDFNVANENSNEKQFQPKSTSQILSRIISIENKTKPHNEGNQNDVQKIKIK